MNILQVSMQGSIGGAGKTAVNLHKVFYEFGHKSMLAVGYPTKKDLRYPGVFRIKNNKFRKPIARGLYFLPEFLQNIGVRGSRRLLKAASLIAEPNRYFRAKKGYEDYEFPATKHLVDYARYRPHIFHCHNLHTEYFDLRVLPILSKSIPVAITLHDMWLLTGHCAHAMECGRWQSGCGECPDLDRYPSVRKDRTRENSGMKREIISRSGLHIATPSVWLMNLVKQLNLKVSNCRVINNGVDTNIYRAIKKDEIRQELGLPLDARIILIIGDKAAKNRIYYKDHQTIDQALQEISFRAKANPIFLLRLGNFSSQGVNYRNFIIKNYVYIHDEYRVARMYQAANVLLYASNADTFPTVILESLACGTPVVASSVGGIPEQIRNGVTGYLVSSGDPTEMAWRATQVISDNQLQGYLSLNAARDVRKRFDLHNQAKEYLNWYEEILDQRSHKSGGP